MKKVLSFVLAFVFVIGVCFSAPFTLKANAASASVLTFELDYYGESYSVTDCIEGASGKLVIPSKYNGLPVTKIGDQAFYNCGSLTSITIPDSVTSIGDTAFCNCSSLTSITIPDSVTSIGDTAFGSCTSLTSITIPDSVTSIARGAFYECSSLQSVTIGNGIRKIGQFAFRGCDSVRTVYISDIENWCEIDFADETSNPLYVYFSSVPIKLYLKGELVTELVIPEGITKINDYAFYNCGSLTSIRIPDSVTNIGDCAFYKCFSLKSITIPDSVTDIASVAFYNTGYYNDSNNWENDVLYIGNHLIEAKGTLSGDCIIKDGTKCIADYAFSGCTSLENVTIPDSVTSMGTNTFMYCDLLKGVSIGNSVTKINDSTFWNCKSLSNIVIPDNITDIDSNAFSGCTSLASITISDSVTDIASGAFDDTAYYNDSNNWDNNVLYIGNHLIEAKDTLSGDYVIKNGTRSICDNAFSDCLSLTSVMIPDSVACIGDNVFANCKSLTNIEIPDSVNRMGYWIFSGFKSLENVKLSKNSVTNINDHAFSGCTSLTSITIPDSVTSIGDYAFGGCSNLNAVYITDLVSWCNIDFRDSSANPLCQGANLYLNEEQVTDLVIPEGVTKIKKYAFYNCRSLTSVKIPDGVTVIEKCAFYNCISLKSITIPDSIESIGDLNNVGCIGDEPFVGCTSLECVYITDLASWCNIDFDGGSSNPLNYADNLYLNGELVTDVVIPDGVEKIPVYAFSCTSLTSVTIPESVTSIGGSAFGNCGNLKDVYIEDIAAWCNIDFGASSANPLCYAKNLYLNGELVTELVIPEGVTEIKSYAFYKCTFLTNVTIPDSVTSIGYDAFYGCSNLSSVYISDLASWCNIDFMKEYSNPLCYGENLYLNGNLVTDIVIPEGISKIKKYAFYNCGSLTSAKIPNGVMVIEKYAFYNCNSLESVTIPGSVISIGYAAFEQKAFYQNFRTCYPLKYVFYIGSDSSWENISIDDSNIPIISACFHYNVIEHSHSVTINKPLSEVTQGSIEDKCTVCGFIHRQENLMYVNEYIATVDYTNTTIDTNNDFIILDISNSNNLTQSIVVMDGYILNTTPNSDYGYYGTGSKVQVTDSNGTQVAEYTLVVRGDVNGDSVCDVLDCMLIELARNNHKELNGIYLNAGDLTENGSIDVYDFEAVVNKAIA